MIVYGVALLSSCLLVGLFVGDLIGDAMGVNANVGGVGIAMILLIVIANTSDKFVRIGPISGKGIHFWSAMYIPIVVAMAAKQNVFSAIESGPVALVAGGVAVTVSFLLIPVLSRWGGAATPLPVAASDESQEEGSS